MQPLYLQPGGPLVFPDPRRADREGLVAVGGDLSVERLLLAYGSGIFPWYETGVPPLWWSPDPRAVLPRTGVHVSRSLLRRLRRGGFDLTWNRAFRAVMHACAEDRAGGTWILPEMIEAYGALHAAGHAHSLEVWEEGRLIGGLYGVQVGALFAAESMFHRRTDASKVALVACARSVAAAGIDLFDVQMLTSHLARFGAVEWPRDAYLRAVARAREERVDLRALVPDWAE